jgi:hygromycin-B 4-O-kinase
MLSYGDAQRFVQHRYGTRAGALTPLPAGEWSRPFAFVLDGHDAVVRFGVHGDDFGKDARMWRCAGEALAVPEMLDLGDAPGGFFAVTRRAFGDFLDELDDAGMRVALPAVLDTLRVARGVDMSWSSGYGLWRPDGTAPHPTWPDALLAVTRDEPGDRIAGWRRALEDSPTGAGPFDAAAEALRALAERCPSPRELVHSDLLYRNVLVDGPAVSAVLDWGNALVGDGLYDLAWLLYWWPWYPLWRDVDVRAVIAADLDGPDADDRLRCYQVHIGLTAQAYNAYTGRFDELAENARQTLVLAAGG